MATIRTTRDTMSPSEKAALERRIARDIQQGAHMTEIRRRRRVSEDRIRDVAQRFGLTITAGKGGAPWV